MSGLKDKAAIKAKAAELGVEVDIETPDSDAPSRLVIFGPQREDDAVKNFVQQPFHANSRCNPNQPRWPKGHP